MGSIATTGNSGISYCGPSASATNGTTCPLAIAIASGVPTAVNVPDDGERWYKITNVSGLPVSYTVEYSNIGGAFPGGTTTTGPDCNNRTSATVAGSWYAATAICPAGESVFVQLIDSDDGNTGTLTVTQL